MTILEGHAQDIIPQLKTKYNVDTLDFVFLDHWKDRYAPDTILLEVSRSNDSLETLGCLGSPVHHREFFFSFLNCTDFLSPWLLMLCLFKMCLWQFIVIE